MKYFLLLLLAFMIPAGNAGAEVVTEDIDDAYVQNILDSGNTSALQKLIDDGLDVNSLDAQGNTLLFYLLTHYADFEMAKTLIHAGADVNLPSNNGLTPLLVATALAQEMQKAQPHTGNSDDALQTQQTTAQTEQQQFLMKRSLELLKLLLDNGADVNQETPRGTALMSAATSDLNLPLIETLLQSGAKINQQDRFGRTALFYAAAFGCDNVSLLLIKNGADIRITDINGKSYLDVSAEDIIKTY